MRKFLISAISLLTIGIVFVILLNIWEADNSSLWPQVSADQLSELNFSGGQNFSLKKIDNRWFVVEGNTQSLADKRRLDALLDNIKSTLPQLEATKNLGNNTANASVPATQNTLKNETGTFGPATAKPLQNNVHSDSIDDSANLDASILPTTLTLHNNDTWTISPQVYLEKENLVQSKVIKNGTTQIIYLDPALIRHLSRPARYYADMRLFSAKPERVLRISATSPAGDVWELAKLTEGTFSFIQPERFKDIEVPQAGMEFYLHAILSTQSPGYFFKSPPGELDSPFLTVKTLQSKKDFTTGSEQEEEILTISRLKNSSDFVGHSSYQQAYFIISAQKVEQLGRSLLSLRSRPILPNGVGQVQAAKLIVWNSKGEEQIREFSRSDSGWSEFDNSINLIGVDTIFWRLGTLQTEGRTGHNPPEDLNPVMRWEFFYNNDTPSLELTFLSSPQDSSKHWVQVGPEGPLYPVHYGAINEILGLLPAAQSN